MSAEFLVIGGARAGETFALGERAVIGSDAGCDVRLDEPGVAPFHAVVVRAVEGGYRLAIVEGASDLTIGGVPRRDATLYHGQRLTIGSVELQLLSARERDPSETNADFGIRVLGGAGLPAPVERVWKSDKFKSAIFESGVAARDLPRLGDRRDLVLRGLYLVGQATTERSLARILERTADAIITALGPDRLTIVLVDDEGGAGDARGLVPAVVRRGVLDHKGARVPVSAAIVSKSMEEGLSVLTRVRHEGEEDGDRPVASVPLSTRTERVGALYVEKLPRAASFDDEDLDFLGAVGRIVGLSIERARLEADARSRAAERDRERSRWHAVVQALRSGVLILDTEGKIVLANPAARKILKERLGVVGDVSALADLGGLPLAGLVKRADGDPIEVVVPGSPEAVLVVRPSPVIDPDGTPSGAALLVNDETEARLREARLLQAEKLSSLGELLAGVAHELNTPLATILGYAEILSHKASDHQRSSLAAILEEAERCRRVVSTLLSFVRPRKAERLDLDVGAIAGSVLDIFAHDLSAVHIEVRRELAPLPPVRADRYELQQVFLNLIRNAREAILGTGRPGRIAVVASVKAGRARVEVRDSGPGFPKEAQGLLVPRPFFTTKESGTGLGLSIALGIVHDHGGEIHASEAPEGGASIAVELPLAVTEAPAVSSAVEAAVPPERAGRSRRVLIVDDEPHVRDLLAQICRELGHVPVLATDGLDALEVLAGDARIDAVLSDVRMPRMDGMAFYRELVARRHPLAARLVFLSGDLARAETTAFLEGTARPVLPKPFRLAQVCRALEDVLPTA